MELNSVQETIDVALEFVNSLEAPEYGPLKDAIAAMAVAVQAARDWFYSLSLEKRNEFALKMIEHAASRAPSDIACECDEFTLRRAGCQCVAGICDAD